MYTSAKTDPKPPLLARSRAIEPEPFRRGDGGLCRGEFVQSVHFVQTCQMPMNGLDRMNGLDKFTADKVNKFYRDIMYEKGGGNPPPLIFVQ